MRDPSELIQRFKSRVHVLDGGLATELEKRGHDISGKLWSAKVLLDDPGAIEQLHYDYLKAGADIIITSSYQLTFQGMKEAGYTQQQAEDALWKSVEVAVKARDRYLSELPEDLPEDRKPLIAASIGPYGAYLADGSEYTGDYPVSANQLEGFHWDQIRVLRRTDADFFAFETIPGFKDLSAITVMMMEFGFPGWFSFSCKDSETLWDGTPAMNASNTAAFDACTVGVGVNCTAPRHILGLLRNIAEGANISASTTGVKKSLVVYPSSGEGWDAEHRCWVGENDAEHFAEHAREWIKAGANIIGGCCRTGPEHIAQLRALVDGHSPSAPGSP